MEVKKKFTPQQITGQVMYMGPHIRHLGLGYSAIFLDGVHPHLYKAIEACPALGALFVPVAEIATVRRELAFDYAHNMCGTSGSHVVFYKAVQQWIAEQTKQKKTAHTGITLEPTHA